MLIVGSGGYVADSVLPYAPKGTFRGILAGSPVRVLGLAQAFGLRVFTDFDDAQKAGLTRAYICSASHRHIEDVRAAVSAGFSRIWVEKPLIVSLAQWQLLQPFLPMIKAVMIKRDHRILKDRPRVLSCCSDMGPLHAATVLQTGGPFLNELIHYLDAAMVLAGTDAEFSIKGTRIRGEIYGCGRTGNIRICYDFNAPKFQNDLAFYPDLMRSFFKDPAAVLLNDQESSRLYNLCFDLLHRLRGES